MAEDHVLETISSSLESDQWTERRAALGELAAHVQVAPGARSVAVQRAYARLEKDDDSDVQAAAITALAALEPDKDKLRTLLVDTIGPDNDPVLRLSAAVAMCKTSVLLGTDQVASLLEALRTETGLAIQAALAKAIAGSLGPQGRETAQAEMARSDFSAIRGGALLAFSLDPPMSRQEVGGSLVTAAAKVDDPELAFELDVQHLGWSNDPESDMSAFCRRTDVSSARRATMYLFGLEHSVKLDEDLAEPMTRDVAEAIRSWRDGPDDSYASDGLQHSPDLAAEAISEVAWYPDRPTRATVLGTALRWLAERPADADADADAAGSAAVESALWLMLAYDPQAVDALLQRLGPETFLAQLPSKTRRDDEAMVGRALLMADRGEQHADSLRPFSRQMTKYVYAALQQRDSVTRMDAAGWVSRRAADLDPEFVQQIRRLLEQIQKEDSTVRDFAQTAISELNAASSRDSLEPVLRQLREGDDEQVMRSMEKLRSTESLEVTREIVDDWVCWIGRGDRASVVETAAELLRRRANAILPVLEHLSSPLSLTDDLRHDMTSRLMGRDVADVLRTWRRDGSLDAGEVDHLREFLRRSGGWDEASPDSSLAKLDRDRVFALVDAQVEKARKEREVLVKRRLARHLSQMSEKRFFAGDDAAFARVRDQLRMHAVPALGRSLIDESDVDTRDSMARVLGNIGGKNAVDALARAVTGEEQTRKERRDTLGKYYLEPSMRRSDQAANLLKGAVKDAKRTLLILQILNFCFATIGLLSLAAGLYTLLFTTDPVVQFAGGAVSVAAFFGLVLAFVREPLDRIQQAMNRLVQLETAFTSFIWELNLNGTFIQSQYVARGWLESAEIADTVERIESAMRLSMELVSTYSDSSQARIVPFIDSVLPGSLGDDAGLLVVKGAWLKGGSSSRIRPKGTRVHLNHQPWSVEVLSWSDNEIQLRLPARPLRDDGVSPGGVGWLSFVVSGRETNALMLNFAAAPPSQVGGHGLPAPRGRVDGVPSAVSS